MHTVTPKNEWKPWPPKAPANITQTAKKPEKIGLVSWIIIICIGFFLRLCCTKI